MQILLDQAVYSMRNKGNIALLHMAVRRLRQLWPEASLEVMTDPPHILKLYCPEAYPVSIDDRYNWSENREKFEDFHRIMPDLILRLSLEIREEMIYRGLTPGQIKNRFRRIGQRTVVSLNWEDQVMATPLHRAPDSADLEHAMMAADMVIGTGGGYLGDTDWGVTGPVLRRLERAQQMGKFTAMVGQGVSPIDDPEIRAVASSILPKVDIIVVRERDFSIPLLESLGVPSERIYMGGDDAVELAYEARSEKPGLDLGISIRSANYTRLGQAELNLLRPVLQQAAARHGTRLRGIPTRSFGSAQDQDMIWQLIAGSPNCVQSRFRFESLTSLIENVGRCRVVVAGAFHGAVFALSQGIPTIGLVRTKEYAIKFNGLVDQFGSGCQVIHLDEDDFAGKLSEAIDFAWESADELRPQLLEAALTQIHLGQCAYRRLRDLYESRIHIEAAASGVQAVTKSENCEDVWSV